MKTALSAGAYTALVTPFLDDVDRSIDWNALDALVDEQVAGGITGLVPCGTTGESPTLSGAERLDVIARIVARSGGRVPVIAGTGTNSTRSTIEGSLHALRVGANAVMLVVPYYNKPTQAGLRVHFIECARAIEAPIVIYNIPGRCGVDLLPDTLEAICDAAPNVVAVKESTGNVLRCQELVRRFGDRLAMFSGDDTLTLPMMSVGAQGVISVTSNLYPREVVSMVTAALSGDFETARASHLSMLPVHDGMFVESNPGPIKAALAAKGKMSRAVRLPLVEASGETQAHVTQMMARFEGERS